MKCSNQEKTCQSRKGVAMNRFISKYFINKMGLKVGCLAGFTIV